MSRPIDDARLKDFQVTLSGRTYIMGDKSERTDEFLYRLLMEALDENAKLWELAHEMKDACLKHDLIGTAKEVLKGMREIRPEETDK